MNQVRIFEAMVSREGRVTLSPSSSGFYHESRAGWMKKGLFCDFSSNAEAVAEQFEDALNWVMQRNPGYTVQLVASGSSVPGGVFWIVASPK